MWVFQRTCSDVGVTRIVSNCMDFSNRHQGNTSTDHVCKFSGELGNSNHIYVSANNNSNNALQFPASSSSLYAVPKMVLASKRVAEYFDSDQLANYASAFRKSRKVSQQVCCPSNACTAPKRKKRKASNSLEPRLPLRKQSNYDWRGESLPFVSGKLAEKFPSLIKGRPPDL